MKPHFKITALSCATAAAAAAPHVLLTSKPGLPLLTRLQTPCVTGWNLINEPRCFRCSSVLEGWVKEMAAYVKALDPNHLLTVGGSSSGQRLVQAPPSGAYSWGPAAVCQPWQN